MSPSPVTITPQISNPNPSPSPNPNLNPNPHPSPTPTPNPNPTQVTITPQVSMLGAAQIMAESRLNRLLVTSAEGSDDLIGIISSTDLVFALLGCGADDADADVAIDPRRLGNLYRPGIY